MGGSGKNKKIELPDVIYLTGATTTQLSTLEFATLHSNTIRNLLDKIVDKAQDAEVFRNNISQFLDGLDLFDIFCLMYDTTYKIKSKMFNNSGALLNLILILL